MRSAEPGLQEVSSEEGGGTLFPMPHNEQRVDVLPWRPNLDRSRYRGLVASLSLVLAALVPTPSPAQGCTNPELIEDFRRRLEQGAQALGDFGGGEVAGLTVLLATLEKMGSCKPCPGGPVEWPAGDQTSVNFFVSCDGSPVYFRFLFQDAGEDCELQRIEHEVDPEIAERRLAEINLNSVTVEGDDVPQPECPRVLTLPVRQFTPRPSYTPKAKKAGIQGEVILRSVLDKQGRVTKIEILEGLPKGLNEQAIQAVKEWRFTPAKMNGVPVEVYYILRVRFTLE